jgi:DNA/RNA endonuclease G (NUC1)
MKKLILLFTLFLTLGVKAQTQVVTNNKLIIQHDKITLYLTDDTCSMVSKQTLNYSDFKKLDSDRDDRWFQDTYKGKYSKEPYVHSGYDLGHLTPAHITSYNDTLNHSSFSLFNQAPQVAAFNRGKWAQLESHVEDTIAKYKSNVVIITGVIYDPTIKEYLGKSRIPIPTAYFKVLVIKKKTWCWIGSNNNGSILPVTLAELNHIFKINKMNLIIK